MDKGESAQNIDNLLEQLPTSEQYVPHEDEETWFVECGRERAEAMLQGKAEGTFLIRPSRHKGSYALSVVSVPLFQCPTSTSSVYSLRVGIGPGFRWSNIVLMAKYTHQLQY